MLITATESFVRDLIPELISIHPHMSRSLANTLDEIDRSELSSIDARVAIEKGVGFVLLAPCVSSNFKLVAYVRPEHRRRGRGRELVREVLGYGPLTGYEHDVWSGNESAYRFWKSVGVIP